jgi:hypothetical protein
MVGSVRCCACRLGQTQGRDATGTATHIVAAIPNAVTTEAGCAKGVPHRHFTDFVAELLLYRIARIDHQAAALRESAGTGTVAGNLTGALMDLFGSAAPAIIGSSPGMSCAPRLR